MISHLYKRIFVHQRKCAGTSICCALNIPWSRDSHDWHFMDGGVNSDDSLIAPHYFTFSIVRNPFDRFISGWKYCESKGSPRMTITDLLKDLPHRPADGDDADSRVVHDYVHITRPQHEILYRPDGSLGVHFVMRFETLQSDFDLVCRLLKIPQTTLPHMYKGNRLPYQHYFEQEPEARPLLESCFQKDLELFDYHY